LLCFVVREASTPLEAIKGKGFAPPGVGP